MTAQSDREETLIKKYGSKEGLAKKRREWQQKSMLNPKRKKGVHKGGMSYATPERRKELGRLGAKVRWRDHEKEA